MMSMSLILNDGYSDDDRDWTADDDIMLMLMLMMIFMSDDYMVDVDDDLYEWWLYDNFIE